MPHPAYPTAAEIAIEHRAEEIFACIVSNNERIRAILAECAEKLTKCDMDGVSMVPGYDLRDIAVGIAGMMPEPAGKAMVNHANELAFEHARDGR